MMSPDRTAALLTAAADLAAELMLVRHSAPDDETGATILITQQQARDIVLEALLEAQIPCP